MKLKNEVITLPSDIDIECIDICNTLNSLPETETFTSCCGHLKDRFNVWFFCYSIDVLSRLGRAVERNYSNGKWEIVVDSTDTHPIGVFWLRSKEPFKTKEEMRASVNSLIDNINYWAQDVFDEHFSKASPEDQPSLPSNLDEAAEDCIENLIPQEIHTTTPFAAEFVVKLLDGAFRAGAEWMAEQIARKEK